MNNSRMSTSGILITLALIATEPASAQINKDTSAAQRNEDEIFARMLDYSRPGKYHRLLADLVGTWTFKGRHFSGNPNADSNKVVINFSGTMERKPFANGRFFIVEEAGGKLQIPIQGGKMKEANAKQIEIEGYDNVKNKFEKALISNHLGSNIAFFHGIYDSIANSITFNFEDELVPGIKTKVREVFRFLDNAYYNKEYYNEKNGKYIKVSEMNYTRVKKNNSPY